MHPGTQPGRPPEKKSMANHSSIRWTYATWNPLTGCTKVSAGCKNCYAERMARRLQAIGAPRYANGFALTLHPESLDLPRRWRKPRTIFVNSMSDVFHEAVPEEFIARIFEVMASCPQHTFQMLTKRSGRLRELAKRLPWPDNIWMGVTVENVQAIPRVEDLRRVPAAIRFLSCEPLLGPLEKLPLDGIGWVIVGGESGPFARPMREEWVLSILQQCRTAGVPFFFKQWGGVNRKKNGRLLQGRLYEERPSPVQRGLFGFHRDAAG